MMISRYAHVYLYVIRLENLMPMVSESSDATSRLLTTVDYGGNSHLWTAKVGEVRRQTGYRSGELTPEQRLSIDGSRKLQWKDTLKIIQGYDYEYNTRPDRVADIVNPRVFTAIGVDSGVSPWSVDGYSRYYTGGVFRKQGVTGLQLQGCDLSNLSFGRPTEAEAKQIASGAMRRFVPTAPAFDLFRFFGELKDLPTMGSISNYIPKTAREGGGAVLNQLFGVQPTEGDLQGLAAAVAGSTATISRFLESEKKQIRRSRTMEVGKWSNDVDMTLTGSVLDQQVAWRTGTDILGLITAWSHPYSYVSTPPYDAAEGSWTTPFAVHLSSSIVSEVRSFATFEYFIPRPTGLASRLDLYSRKATQVLGGGFTASATWALTPWSWLADWFLDVGGLLRYQEAVATNSVVATRSGWVSEIRQQLVASYTQRMPYKAVALPPLVLEANSRFQRRGPGGPYDILKGWDLSSSQSAILAALAVSRWSPV